jgi:hypothetical protein
MFHYSQWVNLNTSRYGKHPWTRFRTMFAWQPGRLRNTENHPFPLCGAMNRPPSSGVFLYCLSRERNGVRMKRKGWFREETNFKPEFRISSHYVKFYRSSDFSLPLSSLIHGGSQTCTISKRVAQEYETAISLAFYFVPSFLTQRASRSSPSLKMHSHSFNLLSLSAIYLHVNPVDVKPVHFWIKLIRHISCCIPTINVELRDQRKILPRGDMEEQLYEIIFSLQSKEPRGAVHFAFCTNYDLIWVGKGTRATVAGIAAGYGLDNGGVGVPIPA